MPSPLLPDDDLYARLEVAVDASPEAIEFAWRALLKLHHPDVAGDDSTALARAKRINVAHDWLSDPGLRARYDRERVGAGAVTAVGAPPAGPGRTGVRQGRPPRRPPWWGSDSGRPPSRPARSSRSRPGLFRGEPTERLARFLDRVDRLTTDELDRLAAAEPPPIAFLATIRRFLAPDARDAFAAAEAALTARVPRERWTAVGLREGLLGVAAELVLTTFLDDTLAEPFRGRARERLLRAWEASLDQPRYGPNGADVIALRARVARMTPAEVTAFVRASQGTAGEDRPWPMARDPAEDEALRISALLAARDVADALPGEGQSRSAAARARRLIARQGHIVAIRHAFPSATYASLVGPFAAAVGDVASTGAAAPKPGVSRAG